MALRDRAETQTQARGSGACCLSCAYHWFLSGLQNEDIFCVLLTRTERASEGQPLQDDMGSQMDLDAHSPSTPSLPGLSCGYVVHESDQTAPGQRPRPPGQEGHQEQSSPPRSLGFARAWRRGQGSRSAPFCLEFVPQAGAFQLHGSSSGGHVLCEMPEMLCPVTPRV